MKPFIRITIGDGGVVGVESNLPDTDVLIYDMDQGCGGDDPRSTLVADFPVEGMELPNTERLTDEERRRSRALWRKPCTP